jgi:Acetyltransferase (isoleucine patch superfamily)
MPVRRYSTGYGGDNLTIGDYCSIAAGVTILLGNEHGTDWLTTYPFSALTPEDESIQAHPPKGDIAIGNDVWIGMNTLVLSGTTIGDGAVIGAGSVVRGNIPAYAIAIGSPCRVVMYRFNPDTISVLLALRWWDWPDDIVTEALPILRSDDVNGLMDFARRHSLLLDEPGTHDS